MAPETPGAAALADHLQQMIEAAGKLKPAQWTRLVVGLLILGGGYFLVQAQASREAREADWQKYMLDGVQKITDSQGVIQQNQAATGAKLDGFGQRLGRIESVNDQLLVKAATIERTTKEAAAKTVECP